MLSVDHQSYATNPIIARALYLVKYIEEVGSGTSNIFAHCVALGLEPPIFEFDARHVSVTVIRPTFGEHGRKVGQKPLEVGQKIAEVGTNGEVLGANPVEVRANFDSAMANYRKDFREICFIALVMNYIDSAAWRTCLSLKHVFTRSGVAFAISMCSRVFSGRPALVRLRPGLNPLTPCRPQRPMAFLTACRHSPVASEMSFSLMPFP